MNPGTRSRVKGEERNRLLRDKPNAAPGRVPAGSPAFRTLRPPKASPRSLALEGEVLPTYQTLSPPTRNVILTGAPPMHLPEKKGPHRRGVEGPP